MAALSSDATWALITTKGVETISSLSMIVKSTKVLYNGSFCTIAGATGDEIQPYAGTVTHRAVGWHFGESVTGNASGTRVSGRIVPGGFQARKAVTGLNGTTPSTDYGKKVYISNDNDLTLTGTTATMHVGYVIPNREGCSTTTAWIYFRNMLGKVGGQ